MLVRTYTEAAIVEKIVEGMLQNYGSDVPDVYTKVYQNGREQGFVFFSLKNHRTHVFVTEHRNSDDIQCVVSTHDDMFNEEEFKRSKCFRYNEHYKAAEFVLDTVLGKNWRAGKDAAEG